MASKLLMKWTPNVLQGLNVNQDQLASQILITQVRENNWLALMTNIRTNPKSEIPRLNKIAQVGSNIGQAIPKFYDQCH